MQMIAAGGGDLCAALSSHTPMTIADTIVSSRMVSYSIDR